MKTPKRILLIISFALAISQAAFAKVPSELLTEPCVPDTSKSMQAQGRCNNVAVNDIPASPLSEAERQGLIFMREEEKLAHDVYVAMSEVWDIPIFNNISRSESVHMEAVLGLLDKYKIPDPVSDTEPGKFTNADFTKLHQTLVNQGNNSLIEALEAGAFIEETDIADLRERMIQTDNEDLKMVYDNLLSASYRHLRAYIRNLAFREASYAPQRLSKQEFDEILSME
jgi:hypothetical protein